MSKKEITQIAIERQYLNGEKEDKSLFELNEEISIEKAVEILNSKIKTLWRCKDLPFFEHHSKGQWGDDEVKLGCMYGSEYDEKVFAVYIMGEGALKVAKKLNYYND